MSTPNAVHVNKILADFAVKYRPKDLFIADFACPVKTVTEVSDAYWVWSRADAAKTVTDDLSDIGDVNQTQFSLSTDNYVCKGHGLKDYIPLDKIATQDEPLDLETDTMEDLMTALLMNRELRVATLVTTSGNYSAGNTGAVSVIWTTQATSTPVQDINGAIRACAMPPNAGFMDELSWHALRTHPQIISTLRGTGSIVRGQATAKEVADYFDLDAIYVGKVKYNTAKPGQTPSYGYIWPQGKVIIGRVPAEPKTKDIMVARTFRFSGDPKNVMLATPQAGSEPGADLAQSTEGITVQTWDDPAKGTAGVRGVKVAFRDAEKMVAPDAGYLLTGAA